MVLRHVLVLAGLAISSGLLSAQPEPAPGPPPPSGEKGEGRAFGPRAQEIRERILARRRGEEGPDALNRPRPFLLMGDPRFEKISRLAFVPEDQLDQAIQTWAEENGMDEKALHLVKQMALQTRKRIEHKADKYIQEKGLAVDESNREAFLKRFLEMHIEAERQIRARAEAELEHAREGIDQRLREEFGPASGG